jgi:hypothetical protein
MASRECQTTAEEFLAATRGGSNEGAVPELDGWPRRQLRWLRQAGALLCVVIQFSIWSHEELRLSKVPLATKSRLPLLAQHIQIRDLSVEVNRSVTAVRGGAIVGHGAAALCGCVAE